MRFERDFSPFAMTMLPLASGKAFSNTPMSSAFAFPEIGGDATLIFIAPLQGSNPENPVLLAPGVASTLK